MISTEDEVALVRKLIRLRRALALSRIRTEQIGGRTRYTVGAVRVWAEGLPRLVARLEAQGRRRGKAA